MTCEGDALDPIYFVHLSSGADKTQPSPTHITPTLLGVRAGVLPLVEMSKETLWGWPVSQGHVVIESRTLQLPSLSI